MKKVANPGAVEAPFKKPSPGYRKGTTRAGGRPRKSPDQQRARTVAVILTDPEHAQAVQDARRAGLRLGPYFRTLWTAGHVHGAGAAILATSTMAAEKVAKRGDLRQLLSVLAGVGNNLNQATRHANGLAKGGASNDDMARAVREIAAMRVAFREAMAQVVAWPAVQVDDTGEDEGRATWAKRMEARE
jgi:hypothetical protein